MPYYPANPLGSKVGVSELETGTDGELITWDASGNPTTVGVGTSGQVLTSNGAGAAPTFQDASGGSYFISKDGCNNTSSAADNNYNDFRVWNWADNAKHNIKVNGYFPATPTAVKVVVIGGSTGTMAYYTTTDFGAHGEAHNVNSDAEGSDVSPSTVSLTAGQITEIDITASFTGAAAGDYFGINFTRDGDDAADTVSDSVYFVGIRISW